MVYQLSRENDLIDLEHSDEIYDILAGDLSLENRNRLELYRYACPENFLEKILKVKI
jgi:hypothetical protein